MTEAFNITDRRFRTVALALIGIATVVNTIAIARLDPSGRPILTASSHELNDLMVERSSVVAEYQMILDLGRTGVRNLALEELFLDVDDLDGLADIELTIRPVAIDPDLLEGAGDLPGLRGTIATGSGTYDYIIVAVGDPDRAGKLVNDTLIIAPEDAG